MRLVKNRQNTSFLFLFCILYLLLSLRLTYHSSEFEELGLQSRFDLTGDFEWLRKWIIEWLKRKKTQSIEIILVHNWWSFWSKVSIVSKMARILSWKKLKWTVKFMSHQKLVVYSQRSRICFYNSKIIEQVFKNVPEIIFFAGNWIDNDLSTVKQRLENNSLIG
jgi:hypothetical protein